VSIGMFSLGPVSAEQESPTSPAPAPSTESQAAGPGNSVRTVLVPRGTLIVVSTNRGINSYGDQTGSKVTFTVAQDVIVDGYVVVKKGDVAEGAVANSQAGRDDFFTQKAANLRLSVDRIFSFCGDTIDGDFQRSEYRRRQGFLGSHKDVEVIKGQLYQVPTERPQRVCAEPTTEQPLPIPSDALLGDSK
jgi:hypothetical protein